MEPSDFQRVSGRPITGQKWTLPTADTRAARWPLPITGVGLLVPLGLPLMRHLPPRRAEPLQGGPSAGQNAPLRASVMVRASFSGPVRSPPRPWTSAPPPTSSALGGRCYQPHRYGCAAIDGRLGSKVRNCADPGGFARSPRITAESLARHGGQRFGGRPLPPPTGRGCGGQV